MADKTKAVYGMGGMDRPTPDKLAAEARARDVHEADEALKDTRARKLKANNTADLSFRLSTEATPAPAMPRRAVAVKSDGKRKAY